MTKRIYYCDMDGVLANFGAEPNAVERFAVEKGFFANLQPIVENIQALEELSQNNTVYILSASPNKQADKDKREWIRNHLPFVKARNVILCRNGENKADHMRTKKGILFDDYGKNCREWQANGNISFKITVDMGIKAYIQM